MTTFALDLSKAIDKAKDQAELIVKKIVIELFSEVVEMSPVGNPDLWKYPKKGYVGGRFRANWNISFGSPDLSTTEQIDPSGSGSKGRIFAQMRKYKLADSSVFLTNNLPYAQRLEEGWSEKQAPHGMVRLSIARFNAGYGA
jgi:hypothetical protein